MHGRRPDFSRHTSVLTTIPPSGQWFSDMAIDEQNLSVSTRHLNIIFELHGFDCHKARTVEGELHGPPGPDSCTKTDQAHVTTLECKTEITSTCQELEGGWSATTTGKLAGKQDQVENTSGGFSCNCT